MNTENTNDNAAPLGARSLSVTVAVSPAQAAALAAFAGDRGMSQADALLLLAFMKLNTHGSLEEEADIFAEVGELVLNGGRANCYAEESEPMPCEAEDLKCVSPAAQKPEPAGVVLVPMLNGKPVADADRDDEGEGWKQD